MAARTTGPAPPRRMQVNAAPSKADTSNTDPAGLAAGQRKNGYRTTGHQKIGQRKNGQRKTGPRTAQGKARSSQNAYRHGLSTARGSVGDLSRWTTRAYVLLRELVEEYWSVSVDGEIERYLANLSAGGIDLIGPALVFVAADEDVLSVRRMKRRACSVAADLSDFDQLLEQSWSDLVPAIDRHVSDGLSAGDALEVLRDKAMADMQQLARAVRLRHRDPAGDDRLRSSRRGGAAPLGTPRVLHGDDGETGAPDVVLLAILELRRLDRFEERALARRRKALKQMLLVLEKVLP